MHLSVDERTTLRRQKRAGGGGGGGGGKSGGSSGSSGGGKSGGSTGGSSGHSSSGSTGRSAPIGSVGSTSGSKSQIASSQSNGGGSISTISRGSLFEGRTSGGATRGQVMGTRTFGSGYPGVPSTGVAGRGFPFVFWPLAWEDTGVTTYRHLNNSTEYGPYDNSSRPGGVMMTAAITTMYVTRDNTTFRILADNFTVNSLAKDIQERCRSMLAFPPIVTTYNHSIPAPKPRQAIQYYRASTVCLSLDGYNNTALFDNSTDTPLPTRINKSLLNCINSTIASSVPLVDSTSAALGSYRIFGSPGTGVSASSTMALLLFLVFWISTAF